MADETEALQSTAEALSENLSETVDKNVEQVAAWIETLQAFAIQYGFQILGALVFLLIGLKVANWTGKRVAKLCEAKDMDVTLSRFMGSVVKVVVIAFVAVITLGNFGITIAPLIALAGASAFGATVAIQGPLSNYGAGLSIIMSRPFVVGNTITVKDMSGVVDEIKLAHTRLQGEDGEVITVPNKDIVGQVIVNSETRRVVQTKVVLAPDADVEKAINAIEIALKDMNTEDMRDPQVGLHDFTYGGIVLGVRFWVPSSKYFERRYQANQAILDALVKAKAPLLSGVQPAVLAETLSSDGVLEGKSEDN